MDFSTLKLASPLGLAAWAVLLGVPVGIIALYFLKLRRKPVEVPSTMLWRKSIEDLHVNSLFQRLRRNLLLFLQLLMVALLLLALLGLQAASTSGQGQRLVLVLDESASMAATDVHDAPTRLEKAKAKAREVVENMGGSDLAMVIAFSDSARVVANYTSNTRELIRRIDSIQPTERTTSLRDALQVAAGLANPSKMLDPVEGTAPTEVPAPTVLIFTDGGFADVQGFSLGNLKPQIVLVGPRPPASEVVPPDFGPSNNLAILALQTRRSDERPNEFQIFGTVRNQTAEDVKAVAQLFVREIGTTGEFVQDDAIELTVPKRGDQSFQFDRPMPAKGQEIEVRLKLSQPDALEIDNTAYTLIGNGRRAQVLLVTGGNRYLSETLATSSTETLADVTIVTPEDADGDAVTRDMQAGRYDLVILDGHTPKVQPEANTIYFGAFPPEKVFESPKMVENPVILDWDLTHPLMQYIRDLRIVVVVKAQVVEPPPGAKVLIESNEGPLGMAIPRRGYTDVVFGFGLLQGRQFMTTWPLKISFPLFLYNALQILGNASELAPGQVHRPGQPVVIRGGNLAETITVEAPNGEKVALERTPQGTFVYNGAGAVGIYRAAWEGGNASFAVNLFDPRESDLATRGVVPEGVDETRAEEYQIMVGYNAIEAAPTIVKDRREWWKLFAILALGVLLVEWYIYNRRVYV